MTLNDGSRNARTTGLQHNFVSKGSSCLSSFYGRHNLRCLSCATLNETNECCQVFDEALKAFYTPPVNNLTHCGDDTTQAKKAGQLTGHDRLKNMVGNRTKTSACSGARIRRLTNYKFVTFKPRFLLATVHLFPVFSAPHPHRQRKTSLISISSWTCVPE